MEKIRKPLTIDGYPVIKCLRIPLHNVLLNFDGLPDSEKVGQALMHGKRSDLVHVTLLKKNGDPFKDEDKDSECPSCFQFIVKGQNIDSESVKRVRFPTLDYSLSPFGDAYVEIEMYVWDEH